MSKSPELLKSTSTVALLNLLSRLLGFVRDLLAANVLGAGWIADCFYLAYRIPNMLRSLLAEGALTSAFVPIFNDYQIKSKQDSQAVLSASISFFSIITIFISFFGIIYADQIISLIGPGISQNPNRLHLAGYLTAIMFPYIISVSLLSLINGTLNSNKIFGAASWGQISVNICLIFGAALALFFNQITAAYILAISFVVGGVIQILIQVKPLYKAGFNLRFGRINHPALGKILILMIPAIFGAAIYQVNIFVSTLLASLLQEGSISWLFYADRISQLPIGIFTVALGSVLMPTLSKANSSGDLKGFQNNLINSLRYTSFIIIPFSAAIICWAEPLIRILFEHGAFTYRDSQMTAHALQATALGLWGVSAVSLLTRTMIAKKDPLTPTILGVLSLIITVIISLCTMGEFTHNSTGFLVAIFTTLQTFLENLFGQANLAHAGLALSAGASASILLPIYIFLVSRRGWCKTWKQFLLSTYQALFASIILLSLNNFIISYYSNNKLILLFSLPVSLIFYTAILFFLKSAELHETYQAIMRLKGRIKK